MRLIILANGYDYGIHYVSGISKLSQTDLKRRSRRYAGRLLMLLTLMVSSPWGHAEEADGQSAGLEQEIIAIIAAKQHPYLKLSSFVNRAEDLENLYKLSDHQLLWLGHDHSEKSIAAALTLLKKASVHGLNPANYDADALQRKLSATLQPGPESLHSLALYDTALSLSLLRFLHDLHYGRVNPQGINFNLKLRVKKLTDLPVLIKDSLAQDKEREFYNSRN